LIPGVERHAHQLRGNTTLPDKIKMAIGESLMKKHLPTIILVLIFLIGLLVLLYPVISNYINSIHQSQAIAGYVDVVDRCSKDDIAKEFSAADDYNAALRKTPDAFFKPKLVDGYKDTLDISGTGIMGYLTIDKIDVKLPIYHTTDESILQVAVGHLEGTSLPVGGAGTHSVISGHTGLPSAKLFSDLDELEMGDIFVITMLDRKLTYQVDQIKVVLPSEVDDLQIVDGKDYCTLMTCTPYGINSHRLLVRGTRTKNIIEAPAESDNTDIFWFMLIAIAAQILLILFIVLMGKYRRGKANEKKKK
jgi:sortase A